MDRKNVAIFFGGCSPEYGVSLQSASAVLRHLDRERYCPVPVGITAGGDWFYYSGDVDRIEQDTWRLDEANCVPAVVSPSRSQQGLLVFQDGRAERIRLDAAFPVLHGQNGEDGTVQGLLELAGVPVVGCGVLASAVCMDKARAHALVRDAGMPVPAGFVVDRGRMETALARAGRLGYPLFVKPVRAGSSFGISKVSREEELLPALELALKYDREAIVEERIAGFEVGCAVLGNEQLRTGAVDEIRLQGGFFDFTEKYTLQSAQIHVPARIPPAKAEEIRRTAQQIYRVLGCRGFARVDLFMEDTGRVVFNEVNTIPGFTVHSRFPGMMRAAGMPFEELVTAVIELAVTA